MASASLSGWLPVEMTDSMACVRASIPVAAVRPGGRETVSSGSRIARSGIMKGLLNSSFSPWASSRMTAAMVTSLPVPAVVGMAMKGRNGWVIRPAPS